MQKKKHNHKEIALILPIKGPLNGAKFISRKVVEVFDADEILIIDTAQANSHLTFGKISLYKIRHAIKILFQVSQLNRYLKVYFNFTPSGLAYLRDLIILFLLKQKKCKIVIHLHANALVEKNEIILKFILKNIKIITINNHQTNFLSKYSNVIQINNAIPPVKNILDVFDFNIKRRFVEKNILFFSNISQEKGIFRAINLFNYIKLIDPDISFIIVGGFLNAEVKSSVEIFSQKNPKFRIAGFIEDETEKIRLFYEASCFLFLSNPYYEASPLVLIEALQFGLPIISTPQYVTDDIINDLNGHTFYDDNIEDSKNFIMNLFSNYNYYQKASLTSFSKYRENYNFNNFLNSIKNVIVNG